MFAEKCENFGQILVFWQFHDAQKHSELTLRFCSEAPTEVRLARMDDFWCLWCFMKVSNFGGKLRKHPQFHVSAIVFQPMLRFWSNLGEMKFWVSYRWFFASFKVQLVRGHPRLPYPTFRSSKICIKAISKAPPSARYTSVKMRYRMCCRNSVLKLLNWYFWPVEFREDFWVNQDEFSKYKGGYCQARTQEH